MFSHLSNFVGKSVSRFVEWLSVFKLRTATTSYWRRIVSNLRNGQIFKMHSNLSNVVSKNVTRLVK